MYSREPLGKYVLGICGTLPCALCAADGLYEYLSKKLGIKWEETTADGMFTIQRRECLGACSEAPVMLVNQALEIKLTRAKADAILDECRRGKRKPYFTGRNGK
jgi:NADH-quinone oxidoreductase subunit E